MCGEFEYRIRLVDIWTTALMYGIYVMLFAGSIYVLVWQRPNTCYLAFTVVLFVLATTYTAADLLEILLAPYITSSSIYKDYSVISCNPPISSAIEHEEWQEVRLGNVMDFLQQCVATASYFVADALLIYRCFVLWNNRKSAVVLSLVLLLATTVCNIIALYYFGTLLVLQRSGMPSVESQVTLENRLNVIANAGNWCSLATNIITTFLTVLRIWLMTREIKNVLGSSAVVRYYAIIAMVIESGALFSISLLLVSIVQSFLSIDFDVMDTINQQLLAIAPTLVIVHVGLRKGFDDVQDSLHASHAANSHAPTSRQLNVRATGTLSGIRFQSVQDPESVTSRVERDGEESQDVSIVTRNEKNTSDTAGAMV